MGVTTPLSTMSRDFENFPSPHYKPLPPISFMKEGGGVSNYGLVFKRSCKTPMKEIFVKIVDG